MKLQEIGVLGLGVMGKNLAFNIESRGFTLSVYDRIREKTDNLKSEAEDKNITFAYSIEDFVNSLSVPRKILIMVQAGKAVDNVIDQLKAYILTGDILIDGGNSFFMDTIRRNKQMEKEGFRYIGMGVSGGEEGALKGPAIMAGGQESAYKSMEPILTAISAKVQDVPCCAYVGADGSGHYVKMVHNGIEYADMQLISEAYSLLKNILHLSQEQLHEVFTDWNKGELDSYLIQITGAIFTKIDELTGKPVLDVILDSVGQNGTGKWMSQNALELGVSSPSIAEAVFARCISTIKEERVYASKVLKGPSVKEFTGNKEEFIEIVRKALYASKICAYAQGFALLKTGAKEYEWKLNFSEIASIFRGGCIIRAQFLNKIMEAYGRNSELTNLLLDKYFGEILEDYQTAWRKVISTAVDFGVPVPLFMSTISYYDSYRSANLPANLIQAQRDYFGAHTYRRIDRDGVFHYQWL